VNLALYDRERRTHWALNEWGPSARNASRDALTIGRSRISFERTAAGGLASIALDLDEPATSFFGRAGDRIRGHVKLTPSAPSAPAFALIDRPTAHHWQALAPVARAQVSFDAPRLRFDGAGYCDANRGDGPLERGFSDWRWSRVSRGGATEVVYDWQPRGGPRQALLLSADAHGAHVAPVGRVRSAGERRTPWGIALPTVEVTGDGARALTIRRTPTAVIDDSPFYARWSLAEGGIGESLDLDRFANRFVRHLLGYRIRRTP
jgi:carotenoid 1,2-hydratase